MIDLLAWFRSPNPEKKERITREEAECILELSGWCLKHRSEKERVSPRGHTVCHACEDEQAEETLARKARQAARKAVRVAEAKKVLGWVDTPAQPEPGAEK